MKIICFYQILEFLLGDRILSAPVLVNNARTRNVYLPAGKWRDGNNNDIHVGPKLLENYPAPLNILPYFIRED
jgi:myogenesis-regulating glycosidase